MAVLRQDAPAGGRIAIPAGTGTTLPQWAAQYSQIHIDLGTGDGSFVTDLARKNPGTAVIGLDSNLDHLRGSRKRHPTNLRFVAADALGWAPGSLPPADMVTINFPYGSLLRGVVEGDERLVQRLDALLRPGGRIEVRINASALVAGGFDPEGAAARVASTLRRVFGVRCGIEPMERTELRTFPSRWAKRLGYGRQTDAWLIAGTRQRTSAPAGGARADWGGRDRSLERSMGT
jgi:16S rRNA (adenine(1408)-N(1))-methyltransferase